MSIEEQDINEWSSDLTEHLEFEENLQKKIEARNKPKKAKKDSTPKYYIDPEVLEENLREYVIMHSINPEHGIGRKLGLNIIQIVEEYSKGAQFRSYYNGWHEDMKSRAHEHICRYAHGYNINYVKTLEFLIRWLFRKKTYVLQDWMSKRGISYDKFYLSLLEVRIKTPNGKEKTKMGRKIFEHDFYKLNDPEVLIELMADNAKGMTFTEPVFNEATFRDEIFNQWPDTLLKDFEDQVKRNPFNYLTKYAYNAFIAVIKEEKAISDNSQSFEEKMKYNQDSFDDDNHDGEDRYTQLNVDRLDWGGNLF